VSETLPLHADLASLAGLVGTWRGSGRGEYPTIETFAFEEETRFWHAGAAFLYYHLRSWSPESGAHLHSELGFWRAGPGGRVDVTLAHPLGLTEVADGTVHGGTIELASVSVGRTPEDAAPVTVLERRYTLAGDVLEYEVSMATDTVPVVLHIVGRLERADDGSRPGDL
jgi:THAP4-like, heme-binding beta-barrel domain